jgi:hypothetical protein
MDQDPEIFKKSRDDLRIVPYWGDEIRRETYEFMETNGGTSSK